MGQMVEMLSRGAEMGEEVAMAAMEIGLDMVGMAVMVETGVAARGEETEETEVTDQLFISSGSGRNRSSCSMLLRS
jgi:microcompartment protein CcmK/EutM